MLDNTDKKILSILQDDGRITNSRLAQLVGLSPPAVLERVRRLEKSGVIDKYVAILDRTLAGHTGIVLIASLVIGRILTWLLFCKTRLA